MTKENLAQTIRNIALKPVIAFFFIYALALTCSMAAMEIGSWGIAIFFFIYWLADTCSSKKTIELHTLGAELPIIGLIIVVLAGLWHSPAITDSGSFWFSFGSLRNLALLFFITYAFQLVRNLNALFLTIVSGATIVACYGIWQHFTGIDLWRGDNRALMPITWGDKSVYSTVGLFSHHLTFGHSYMMILCLPWAALLLYKRRPWYQTLGIIAVFFILLTSIIFTYGRGVWIALAVALPFMAMFASRKLFILSLLTLSVLGGVLFKASPYFKDRALSVFDQTYHSNEDRKKIWAINVQMFHDQPWIGVGYRQNETLSQEYFTKMGILEGMSGHAHSNYLEMLATTGILGFSCYMLFILSIISTSGNFRMSPW
jgi:O-antigen ligase